MGYREIIYTGARPCEMAGYYELVDGVVDIRKIEFSSRGADVEGIMVTYDDREVSLLDMTRLQLILFDPFSHEGDNPGIYLLSDDERDEVIDFMRSLEELHREEPRYFPGYLEGYDVSELDEERNEVQLDVIKLERAWNMLGYQGEGDWE